MPRNDRKGIKNLFNRQDMDDTKVLGDKEKRQLDKLDNEIDEILYNQTSATKKIASDNEAMYERIKNMNAQYNNVMQTGNLLEFLTQNQLVNINNLARRQQKVRDLNKVDASTSKKQINEILSNMDSIQLLNAEKDRISRYADYRLIDAYIPQVSRCITLIRDSILSPDDNNKNSLDIKYKLKVPDDIEASKIEDMIDQLEKELDYYRKVKKWIRKGLVDGDVFVAVLKYDTELNSMLLNESIEDLDYFHSSDNVTLTEEELFAEYEDSENNIMEKVFREELEAFERNENKKNEGKSNSRKSTKNDYLSQIKKSLSDALQNNVICIKDSKTNLKYTNYAGENNGDNMTSSIDKPIDVQGCIVTELPPESVVKLSTDSETCLGYLYFEKYDINMEFGREGFGLNVKDLLNASMGGDSYMSSSNYSYTGSSVSQDGSFYMSSVNSSLSGSSDGANNSDYFNNLDGNGANPIKDKFIAELFVKGICKKLDKKTLEENQQFKEIIYQLVKKDYLLNKKVKIVYYSPEEVVHYKPDSEKIYGCSKLSKVYFYAKMLLSNILTTIMQKISRGRDKRVLYVETGLDDDVEASIQEVVRDFKSKEIQSDVLKSVTTILKRVGAFEDYYIPRVDGEAPLDLETISGMDVNVEDDFMNWLLRSIISGMGIPASFVDQSNEVDFSRELLMQNSSFVRDIVSEQIDASLFVSEIFQKAFKYRYWNELGLNEFTNNGLYRSSKESSNGKTARRGSSRRKKKTSISIDVTEIVVEFPVPEFLNLSNTMEQINNYQAKIDFVMQTLYPDDLMNSEEGQALITERAYVRRKYTKQLVTSIDWEELDNIVIEVQKELKGEDLLKKTNETTDDTEENTDDFGMGDETL